MSQARKLAAYVVTLLVAAVAAACASGEVTTDPTATPPILAGTSTPTSVSEVPTQTAPLPPSKEFPAELMPNSEPLEKGQVVSLWTDYLAGTQVLGPHEYRENFVLCGDGTGQMRVPFGENRNGWLRLPPIKDFDITWKVRTDFEDWNRAVVDITVPGPQSNTALQDFQEFDFVDGQLVGDKYESLAIAEITDDPDCSAVVSPEDRLRNPDLSKVLTRPLPAELDPERVTERPSEERVIELWTEYLTDTILKDPGSGVHYHFCDSGVITTLTGIDSLFIEDTPGSWWIERNAAMSSRTWWEVALMAKKSDGIREIELSIGTMGVSGGVASGEIVPVYESEYCKQVVNEPGA